MTTLEAGMAAAVELAIGVDPTVLLRRAGIEPDPWQQDVLYDTSGRVLVVTSRQAGKSTCAAAKALHRAYFWPGSLVLLVAAAQRQAQELLAKVRGLLAWLPRPAPVDAESMTALGLGNRSRIIALPSGASTIRGYSAVDLIVVDEAAWVWAATWAALLPMLTVSDGELIVLTTPGPLGSWCHRAWLDPQQMWRRLTVRAADLARVSPAFLAEQRRLLPRDVFAREYEAEWVAPEGAAFTVDDVAAMMDDDLPGLGIGSCATRHARQR